MNIKGAPEETAAKVTALDFPVTVGQMNQLADSIGEKTLFGRTGGAATLAVGMAQIFHHAVGNRWLDLWYHFAIMFEALFILTTLDAGTRVGRYLLQDVLGNIWRPLGDVKDIKANVLASGLIVAGWGYFLIQGVRDPLGGINSLWPLFGIANQLLAGIALCVATTILLKMHGPKFMWITCVPLVWLVTVTFTAAWQKIFSPVPAIGFLAQADRAANPVIAFNARLDAVVCGAFLVLVAVILADSIRVWLGILTGSEEAQVHEAPFVLSQLRAEEL